MKVPVICSVAIGAILVFAGICANGKTTKSENKSRVINTSKICAGVKGFAGPVPVNIHVKNGKIIKIEPLPNKETPEFFNKVIKSGILKKWEGKTLKQGASMKVDAISGATFSSRALIKNIQEGCRQ